MKKIIIILVLLFSNYSFSQIYYSHYIDNTSEWRYFRTDLNIYTGEINDYYTTYYFDGTETINNKVYYKLYSSELKVIRFVGSTTTTSQTTLLDIGYEREDSDGKFYGLDTTNNTEISYFDNQLIINAQIGQPLSPGYCIVQYINYINIGSLLLKKVNDGGLNGLSYGLVEGVGNLGGFCGVPTDGGGTYLNCYKKQNSEIQFGYLDCSLFPSPLRLSLQTAIFENQNNITVYPNPASSTININLPAGKQVSNFNIKMVELIDVQGRVLVSKTVNDSQATLDVSSLKTGTYFIKTISDKGIATNKFVKN
jgi:Secretion system C-terminal sorting domain